MRLASPATREAAQHKHMTKLSWHPGLSLINTVLHLLVAWSLLQTDQTFI